MPQITHHKKKEKKSENSLKTKRDRERDNANVSRKEADKSVKSRVCAFVQAAAAAAYSTFLTRITLATKCADSMGWGQKRGAQNHGVIFQAASSTRLPVMSVQRQRQGDNQVGLEAAYGLCTAN